MLPGLGMSVRDANAGHVRPPSGELGTVQHSAQAVGPYQHDEATVVQLQEAVFRPAEVTVVVGQPDIAMFTPRCATVAADQHAVPRIGERTVQRRFGLFIIRADIVLEGHDDAAIVRGEMVAQKRPLLESSGHFVRRTPAATIVVARHQPGLPMRVPVPGVGGKEQRAAPPCTSTSLGH